MNVFDSIIAAQFKGVADFLKGEAANYKIAPSAIAYLALLNEGRLLTALVKDRTVLRPLPLANLAMKVFKEELEPDRLDGITTMIQGLLIGAAKEHELTESHVLLVIRVEQDDKPTIWLQNQDKRIEQIPVAEFARMIYNA